MFLPGRAARTRTGGQASLFIFDSRLSQECPANSVPPPVLYPIIYRAGSNRSGWPPPVPPKGSPHGAPGVLELA